MGRYARVVVVDEPIDVKFAGLMAKIFHDVGVDTSAEELEITYEQVGDFISLISAHNHAIEDYPTEAYYVGMVLVWYGMHRPGDVLVFM